MSESLLQSPIFGLFLFIFLLAAVAVYAITLSKFVNRCRDSIFERLAVKYGLSATLAGEKILRPDPPTDSSDRCEMRKISGTIRGKKVIVQDIQDYPAQPADNALARYATPNRTSVNRNNAAHPTTRFFMDDTIVSSSDIWASERQIGVFLDSIA